MKKSKALSTLILIVLTPTLTLAKSQSSVHKLRTDTLYTPSSGQSEFVTEVNTVSGALDATPAGQKLDYSGAGLVLSYGYGISSGFAIYLKQEYDAYKFDYSNPTSSAKSNGLGDSTLGFKGLIGQSVFFYYNLDYTAQMSSAYEDNKDTGELTPGSVRPSINLDVGLGGSIEKLSFGVVASLNNYAKGNYDKVSGGVKTSSSYESGSGTKTKFFLQYGAGWIVGASYEKVNVDSYFVITNGSPSLTASTATNETKVYTIIPVSASEMLISASSIGVESPSGIKSSVINATLGFRVEF